MLEGHLLNERYLIKGTIGGGGMANVLLAWDTILEREVAIKVLRLEYANDQEFIARFDREAQSATSLAHPNIVNIFDVGEEDHLLYMVMEYVDGMTLKEYIKRHGMVEVEEALDIMKQILAAIEHAHANGLVHRDIKPQNILLDAYGQAKVTDFGIALALSATSLTQTNSIVGSVHYLSPEQARGGIATKKSDIYSLGIVLFELLTGRLPFSGQSPVAIALQHLQHETPSVRQFNPDVPQSVENIVLKATAKDPLHRYATVQEMDDALCVALEAERLNEPKYEPPFEAGEETKAMPIITESMMNHSVTDETIIHHVGETRQDSSAEPGSGKDKKRKKRKKGWLIVSILLFVLLIGGGAFAYPILTQPKDTTVPNLTNMEYENAVETLQKRNLKADRKFAFSNEVEEGFVMKADPSSGETIKEESVVTVYVSQGKEKQEFADYTGEIFEDVESKLKKQGYKDVIAYEAFSDKPEGEILRQIQPDANTEVVPSETNVIFEISKGPELVSLSSLKGMTEEEATDYLSGNGLKYDPHEEYSDEVPIGEVISQNPSASTNVELGSTVKVVISKGAKKKKPVEKTITFTVPYAPVRVDGNEGENDSNPPQRVKIFVGDQERDISKVDIDEEIRDDKNYTIKLKIEQGKTGEYKVLRDDQLIMDKSVSYEEGE